MPASPWQRYVAIGDSFTEGMVDPDPVQPDAFVGWADRLAASLDAYAAAAGRDFAYANLAVRGRKLDDIVGPQLEAAVAMGPDLVSMVGGGNDILRPSVDLDILAGWLEEAVIRLRASGADVLLATSGWPRPPSSPWGSRQHPRIGTSRCRRCPPRPTSHKSATTWRGPGPTRLRGWSGAPVAPPRVRRSARNGLSCNPLAALLNEARASGRAQSGLPWSR